MTDPDDWRVRALKAETTVERLAREIERYREDIARLVVREQEARRDRQLPEHAALVYRASDLPADLRTLLADHLDGVTWVAEYRETSAVRALTRGHDAAWLALDGRHFALWSEAPCPSCEDSREARDQLARGEDTPSLDAIRAWQEHGGRWLALNPAGGRLRPDVLTLCDAGHARTVNGQAVGYVTVRDGRTLPEDVRHDLFAKMTEGVRWWRVRDDGTLEVG